MDVQQMNKILEGLYLGNIGAANNAFTLRKNGITHILTAAAMIEPMDYRGFNWMKIDILDVPSADLLKHFDHAVEFIKQGIASGGVLVHCFAGVSRSSSCVIAYLMSEHDMSYWDSLYFVRKQRSVVCPNLGFAKQLQKYETILHERKTLQKSMDYQQKRPAHSMPINSIEAAGYQTSSNSTPSYARDLFPQVEEEKKSSGYSHVGLRTNFGRASSTQNTLSDDQSSDDIRAGMEFKESSSKFKREHDYHCKNCKAKLFSSKDIVAHEPLQNPSSPSLMSSSYSNKFGMNSQSEQIDPMLMKGVQNADTCSQFFIKEQKWIQTEQGNQGLIQCSKKGCEVKLGSYSLCSGLKCRCGRNVKPGYLIYYDMLDLQ
eukprot:403362943